MAERLVQGGENVIVYNRTMAKPRASKAAPRSPHRPPKWATQADIIFACITTADSYRDVVLGPHGLARGSRVKTYVHLGTNAVALLEELAAALTAAASRCSMPR